MDGKVKAFVINILNTYKDIEEKEEVTIELTSDGTEDFTAMLRAMFIIYREFTGEEEDLIGFTHILNRLAVQHLIHDN